MTPVGKKTHKPACVSAPSKELFCLTRPLDEDATFLKILYGVKSCSMD